MTELEIKGHESSIKRSLTDEQRGHELKVLSPKPLPKRVSIPQRCPETPADGSLRQGSPGAAVQNGTLNVFGMAYFILVVCVLEVCAEVAEV